MCSSIIYQTQHALSAQYI